MQLASLLSGNGDLPFRPAGLSKPDCVIRSDVLAEQFTDIAGQLLDLGRAIVIGGVSLMGDEGHIVPMVTAIQVLPGDNLKGWNLAIHDGQPTLRHFDTTGKSLDQDPLPNLMVYFVGVLTREEILDRDASQDEISGIVRFILPFISDEGPPQGIDW